ncbi:hypothetical protein RI367_004429 [Sorochytrium milnesiophthora]
MSQPLPSTAALAQRLSALQTQQSKDKLSLYRQLLQDIVASQDPPELLVTNVTEFLDHLAQDTTAIVNSRPMAAELLDALLAPQSPQRDSAITKELLRVYIAKLSTRAVAFEQQISTAREKLSELLENDEEWHEAAQVLIGIPLDSGHRSVSDEYKLGIYIHIVRLLLEDDNSTSAEAYLNRAGFLLSPSTDELTQVTYKVCAARILDHNRRFVEAAHKYLELSYSPTVHVDEKTVMLQKAVTCAVLAGAGPQRSRMLATLYKDERVQKLGTLWWAVLEKMYLDRILRHHEVVEFRGTLSGHHLALLGDGTTTVLDRAVIEHNLLSASRIYENISFDELGAMLHISPDQAESTAAKMINEQRLLNAYIDQIDRTVFFESGDPITLWNAQIQQLGAQLDDIVGLITTKHPDFVKLLV